MTLRSLVRKPEIHRPDAPVVEFRGVTIHYGDGKPALEDASFALDSWGKDRDRRSQRRGQEHFAESHRRDPGPR